MYIKQLAQGHPFPTRKGRPRDLPQSRRTESTALEMLMQAKNRQIAKIVHFLRIFVA